jgi:hypothetical protein
MSLFRQKPAQPVADPPTPQHPQPVFGEFYFIAIDDYDQEWSVYDIELTSTPRGKDEDCIVWTTENKDEAFAVMKRLDEFRRKQSEAAA